VVWDPASVTVLGMESAMVMAFELETVKAMGLAAGLGIL
jgi:hypothetical protein